MEAVSRRDRGDRTPRARRQRSATDALLSIVLVLESLLTFFLTLVVFSLRVLDPVPTFSGGAILLLLFLLGSRLTRYSLGLWLGFALQAVIIATGLLVPVMYVIGAGFAGLFVYCFITGRRLDRRNRRRLDGTIDPS